MNLIRLEATTIDAQITEGLSSCVADPLWFLARQWQVGEFRGEDAATPLIVEAQIDVHGIDRFVVSDDVTVDRGPGGLPLEALAERELEGEGPTLRHRLESGASLARALRRARIGATFVDALLDAYPVPGRPGREDPLDPVGSAQMRLLARTTFDGWAIRRAVATEVSLATLPELAVVAQSLQTRAINLIEAWRDRENEVVTAAPDQEHVTWRTRHLDHGFRVVAPHPAGEVELTATGYQGGRLDWYHFDVVVTPAAVEENKEPDQVLRALATPLQYGGMPAARWWELEDRDTYFGDLGGGPDDLARSVFAAYGAVAGDDWFSLLCRVPTGSIVRVRNLRVFDNFRKQPTTIRAAAVIDEDELGAGETRAWRWFELAGDEGPANGLAPLLYVPPVVDTVQQGRPLEAVEFRRDEAANLGWAIERRVQGEAERAIDREVGSRARPAAPVDPETWQFVLATDVPDNWIPLVPMRINASSAQVGLRRGRLATSGDDRANVGLGRILQPERPFVVDEEAVPSGGVHVTRRYQMARSSDGGRYLWIGHRTAPSGGPMKHTPLRFDELTGFGTDDV